MKRISAQLLRKAAFFLLVLALTLGFGIPQVNAMCPLCTVGAAAGLGIARYYGVDDSVSGIWLGALAVSTGVWLNKIVKKRVRFARAPVQDAVVTTVLIAATILPFYLAGFFNGMPGMSDTFLGVNKLVIGTVVGGAIMFAGTPISNYVKRARGRVFPYQTMIIIFTLLAVTSIAFWLATRSIYYWTV